MTRISDQNSPDNPRVSVHIITYNHGKFIAQAIESVLMQETDFPVEIIIGEDCSGDNTRQIVQSYAERYPHVVRALFHDRNLGHRGNSASVFFSARGQYIACLEGDDYWTDPHKLQKQVTLMEQNPLYTMCGTAALEVTRRSDGSEAETGRYPASETSTTYSLEYVMLEYPFRTLTILFRNKLIDFPDSLMRSPHLDLCLFALYAEKGPIAYIGEVTGTYRIHPGGVWSGASLCKKIKDNRLALGILNKHYAGRYSDLLLQRDFRIATYRMQEAIHQEPWHELIRAYFGSFLLFIFFKPWTYLKLGILLARNSYKK